jgi:hippurate hydrolase
MPVVALVENDFTPALQNDPALTHRVRGALVAWFGADQVETIDPEMGGEDFSRFGSTVERVPICLLRLGMVDPAKFAESQRTGAALPSLHSSKFAPLPEPTLRTGVTAMTAVVLDILKK